METEELQTPAHEPKIGTPMAFVLIAVAIISDLLNWIPVVNIILAVFTSAFPLYFWFKGLPFSVSLIGDVAEFIPGLSVVPALTASVALTIYADRNPDSWFGKKVSKISALTKGKISDITSAAGPKIKNLKGALGELAQ